MIRLSLKGELSVTPLYSCLLHKSQIDIMSSLVSTIMEEKVSMRKSLIRTTHSGAHGTAGDSVGLGSGAGRDRSESAS